MLVRSVMTRRVVSVCENDTLRDVLAKLVSHDISSVPVISNGRLVGLVTEGDIIKTIDAFSPTIRFDTARSFAVVLAVLKHRSAWRAIKREVVGNIRVADFMNTAPHTIGPNADIYDAARTMNRYNVKMLPVIDKNRKLLGVIARQDIIRALAK